MNISNETVKYVAYLARIELKPKEVEELSMELKDILGFINKLNIADIKDIKPTSHILPINNVFREDQRHPSLSCDETLKNAPSRERDFFSVPKVIE
jgi:aspartyl-tRNA(Asn)/glutamyl-tRNA(Gln) amidotransferase subunit C